MEKLYAFAGVEIAVDLPDRWMYENDRYLAPFRVEQVSDPHRFRFEMVNGLDAPEGECVAVPPGFRVYREAEGFVRYIGTVQKSWDQAYIRAAHSGKEHRIQLKKSNFPGRVPNHTVLNCIAAEHLVPQAGGVIFHSAYIDVGGRAVLFSAPSGTGKSTQAELWRSLRGARILNGDRSVIRNVDGQVFACGIPFAGSSVYCENVDLPLAAIVYLSQAPRTSISRLSGFRAFGKIWEGCSINTWDEGDVHAVTDIVTHAARTVPVYHLACTPDESAVIALETVLKER